MLHSHQSDKADWATVDLQRVHLGHTLWHSVGLSGAGIELRWGTPHHPGKMGLGDHSQPRSPSERKETAPGFREPEAYRFQKTPQNPHL